MVSVSVTSMCDKIFVCDFYMEKITDQISVFTDPCITLQVY